MVVIIAWPDWNKRPDRFLMFSYLAEWCETYLITSSPLSDELKSRLHPKANLIFVRGKKGLSFLLKARNATKIIIDNTASNNEPIILQDMAISRLNPKYLYFSRSNKKIIGVLSLYSQTLKGFKTRSWRIRPSDKLTVYQEFTHLKNMLGRIPLEFISSHLVDYVSGNNQELCEDISKGYKKNLSKVFYFPTEIDTEYFKPKNLHVINQNPLIIFFCGRLLARKGIYDLLEVLIRVRSQGLDVILKLAGDNSLEGKKFIDKVNLLGLSRYVEILGIRTREEIRNLLFSSHLFVLPSYFEGSPRVVKEALASGIPIVTYDIPGTRNLDPNQNAITFVELGNVDSLYENTLYLLKNPDLRKNKIINGFELIEEKYGYKKIAFDLYEQYLQFT